MVNGPKNQQLLTMYKNNSPYICDFKACTHFNLFFNHTGECHTAGYYTYTKTLCLYRETTAL